MACEGKGRDQSDASTSPGMPRIADNSQKLGEPSSLDPVRAHGPAETVFGTSSP